MSPLTETLLMFAARVEHVDTVIVPRSAPPLGAMRSLHRRVLRLPVGRSGIPAEWIANSDLGSPTLQPD